MENAIKEDNVKAEQSVVHSSQSVFGNNPAWFRSMEPKTRIRICVSIAAVLIILAIAAVSVGSVGTKKPQGTYVFYVADQKFATYEFKGNKVEHFALEDLYGNYSHVEGKFYMEDNTVFIEYEDGGKDQFTYNAEKDELDMEGIIILTKEQ